MAPTPATGPGTRRVASYTEKPVGRLLRSDGQLVIANSYVLLNSRLGLLFIAAFATTAAVGVYSAAISAAEVVYLASFSLLYNVFAGSAAAALGSPWR